MRHLECGEVWASFSQQSFHYSRCGSQPGITATDSPPPKASDSMIGMWMKTYDERLYSAICTLSENRNVSPHLRRWMLRTIRQRNESPHNRRNIEQIAFQIYMHLGGKKNILAQIGGWKENRSRVAPRLLFVIVHFWNPRAENGVRVSVWGVFVIDIMEQQEGLWKWEC